MNLLLTNPWLFFVSLLWVICGIVAVFQKNVNALEVAGQASVCVGILYLLTR